ncbi:MAG: metal ABC transporter substrate-binding protein [Actinobacteria bacterium]|nr:metal ABC transporter substrate-binding protein [Actinomycetota bacterium]
MKFKPLVVLLVVLPVVATGCASSEQTSTGQSISCDFGEVIEGRPLNIATTVAPITSIVANIAGGTASVITGVVPEGTNSHTFEPRPSDAATLESADIIFINGLVLEEPTKDLALANIKPSANICELGSEILSESEYIYDFSFPKEGGKPNPHLWTNPPMAKQYAQVVRDVLVRRDPSNAAIYEKNFVAFAVKIDALDDAIKIATATIPEDQRKLLTYHDAYAYFAVEYGFTVIGAIQPSSFDEPTPKEIGELISQVKNQNVKAIFGSEVFPSTVLEQIGAETGVRYVDVLRDDDLIGKPGDPEHSWLGLMRFNFATIVEALGGDATALNSLDVGNVVKDEAKYPQ